MALTTIVKTLVLDVYDHDQTQATIKAIALDSKTRYVQATLTYMGADYPVSETATVTLTVLRPDKVGAQVVGSVVDVDNADRTGTIKGVYAELTQTALAVKGKCLCQFRITDGEQILRTEIFAVNNGQALDADIESWAGDIDGHNLDEMAESIETLETNVGQIQEDLSTVKEDFNNILAYGKKRITGAYITAAGKIEAINTYDLVCFYVSDKIDSLVSSSALVYAFYAEEPSVGSVSYNASRTVLSTATATYNLAVPSGCKWIAVRVATGADATLSPRSVLDGIEQEINVINSDDAPYTFKIGNYSFAYGNVPTYVSTNKNRFCIDGFILIKKGETISTKWSNVSFVVAVCNSDGIYLSSDSAYKNTFTATEDTYAYIVFKRDSINDFTVGNWLESSAYFFHKFKQEDSAWNGKTWYSFGTSMSDINPDGTTGNNGTLGKWPLIVDELSGMVRTNKAIGGGGIVPSASHGGNVKANIMQCPYDVDLVTFECGLNDWGNITLGEIGDKSNDSFIGNFTQCIEYLTYHTRAKLVFISMIPLTFVNYDAGTRRDVFFENSYGFTYREYVNAMIEVCQYYGVEVIDAQANALSNGRCNKDTILDSTHFNDFGGEIYGRYIWSKLKDVLPLPKFPNNL